MNKVIGEMEIKIGKETFLLRPSYRGIAEIEDKLGGLGITAIANKFVERSAGLKCVVAILYGGIVGSLEEFEEPPFSFAKFGEKVQKFGYLKLLGDASTFLATCMRSEEDQKKVEALSKTDEGVPLEK